MNDFFPDLSSSWDSVLSILKEEITEVGFKTWFEPLKPLKFEDNTLYIIASNEIQKNTILMKHRDLLRNSISIVFGENSDFEIIFKNQIGEIETAAEKPAEKVFNSFLNPRYTFEEFVVGTNNNHAHAASLAVAENPGKAYNPLFLYSNAGLGKTHLMHSIGHYILQENPSSKVLYVTSEKFINDLIDAIKDDKREEFRNSYRTVDVLLIDDIQFIAGKKGMQEEFFHTFNTLVESNRQIVITSDRHPREIQNLEERIRTRLESSLIVDIQPPDYETRVAILRKKAQKNNMGIPDEILDIIAKSIKSNIRELEGAIKRITLYCSMSNEPITIDYVMREMKDIIPKTEEIITNKNVLEAVSRYFNIDKEELLSKKRTKEIAYVRQIAMYLCSSLVKSTLEDVGSFFGGRHHTTVMHDIKKIANEMKFNDELKNTITDLTNNIKNEG